MAELVLSLIAAFVTLVGVVMVPVWTDRPWEHEGATEDWSPVAEIETIPIAAMLAPAATGWPA